MILNINSEHELSGFYVVYEGSTNIETPGQYGISHLMEHLIMNNLRSISEKLDRDGIEHNAYTTSNEIVFYINGLDSKIRKWRDKYLDSILNFKTKVDEFENEKKIVLDEYTNVFNDQAYSHNLNFKRKYFNDYSPIGLKSDISSIKYIDCINFFEKQYLNPSKIINISKNVNYKNDYIKFSQNSIDKKFEIGNYNTPFELNNRFQDKTSIIISSPIIEDDFPYVIFIKSLISYGLSSPLYKEVRLKNGLVYYINFSFDRMNRQGALKIDTITSNENTNEVLDSIERVFKTPNLFLNKERFYTIKNLYKIIKKKQNILSYKNVSRWILPKEFDVHDIIDFINIDILEETYYKYFNYDQFYTSIDKNDFK